MAKVCDKVVQIGVRAPSQFTFCGKIRHSTLIANTYNFTCQNLYLLYLLFCRGILYHIYYISCLPWHICCISCSAVTSFIIFVVLAVLPSHSLSYLLYQLFCCSIFYYVCYVSWSIVASFIIFVVFVILLCQLFCQFTPFCYSWSTDHSPTLCFVCFIVYIPRVLGLHTNWPIAWSY